MRFRLGFTFIELLIVLGIMSIIALVALPFFSNSISRNDLQTSAWQLANDLRRARSAAMAAQSNSAWSVHVQSDRHVLFVGTTYNASDPNNLITLLPATITLSAITLNGGGSDVRFSKVKGQTTDFGTITILDNNSGQSLVVSVNAAGHIQ